MIPFNKPYLTGKEILNIAQAHSKGQLSGDGYFTRRANDLLENYYPGSRCLLTHSCTAALEMAAILLDIKEGDEIIMPSYTFVSTANAFALRGAVPVFIDSREDDMNINEDYILSAITTKTKAIVPVHYAGRACNMQAITKIAKDNGLFIVEDAAQAIFSVDTSGLPLGGIGDIGTLSFHETKNIISGEGGALIVNNPSLAERAEIIREKGTDRSKFMKGLIDKYTWVDIGSSYLPGEIIAAFLCAQLDAAADIQLMRMERWLLYYKLLEPLALEKRILLPPNGIHNAHMFYMVVPSNSLRDDLIDHLRSKGVMSVFHYVPLHSSPAGRRIGRPGSTMKVVDDFSNRLIRLPLFPDLDLSSVEYISKEIHAFFNF